MKLTYSNHFRRKLKKILKQKPSLKSKIVKRLEILQKDYKHPTLKTHKLKGEIASEYAISIELNIRILFVILDSEYYLIDIINHDEY